MIDDKNDVSGFYEEILKTAPLLKVKQVYHGVDRKQFYPISEEKKEELKKKLDTKWVVLSSGVNQLRKSRRR